MQNYTLLRWWGSKWIENSPKIRFVIWFLFQSNISWAIVISSMLMILGPYWKVSQLFSSYHILRSRRIIAITLKCNQWSKSFPDIWVKKCEWTGTGCWDNIERTSTSLHIFFQRFFPRTSLSPSLSLNELYGLIALWFIACEA